MLCLAISACYEFVEWGAAFATGSKADALLDPGLSARRLVLSRVRDRRLARLDPAFAATDR